MHAGEFQDDISAFFWHTAGFELVCILHLLHASSWPNQYISTHQTT